MGKNATIPRIRRMSVLARRGRMIARLCLWDTAYLVNLFDGVARMAVPKCTTLSHMPILYQLPHKKSLNNYALLHVMKMSPYEKVLHECLECANESPYRPGKDIQGMDEHHCESKNQSGRNSHHHVTGQKVCGSCTEHPAAQGGDSWRLFRSRLWCRNSHTFLKANGFPAVSESGWGEALV